MGPRASSFRVILWSIYGLIRLQETFLDAAEDELDGQGREDDAEDAGEDVCSGLAKEAHDARGEEQGETDEQQDYQEHH